LFVDNVLTPAVENTYKVASNNTYYIYYSNLGDAKGLGVSVTTSNKTIIGINYLQSAIYAFGKLEIYGIK